MAESYAGFVDIGFLRAEGAKILGTRGQHIRPQAQAIAAWFAGLGPKAFGGQPFLRTYWYDGAFETNHQEYQQQRQFLDAVAYTPCIQLRLGHVAERKPRLRSPIEKALRETADGLAINPDDLIDEFRRHWTFRPERQQKGVDTLIALDMVRLAGRSICSTMVLVAGDRDFAEVVRTVQDFGVRVFVATPNKVSVAREVAQLADGIINISTAEIQQMLHIRPSPGI